MKSKERRGVSRDQFVGHRRMRSFVIGALAVLVAIVGACDRDGRETTKTQDTKPRDAPDSRRLLKVSCPNLDSASRVSITLNDSGLVATRLPVQLKDVTSELTKSDKDVVHERLRERSIFARDVVSTAFFSQLYIEGGFSTNEFVYYSAQTGNLHTCFADDGHDEQLLRWPGVSINGSSSIEVSPHGVVAYEVFREPENWKKMTYEDRHPDKEKFQSAIIIADIPRSTKTAIELPPGDRRVFRLSDDGSTIAIAPWSAAYANEYSTRAATYVVDLLNLSIRAKLNEPLSRIHINENGTRLYTSKGGKRSEIIDLPTGQREEIYWPTTLSRDDSNDTASPNLAYIATTIGMFASFETTPGQWGTLVRTPKGFQLVYSPTREASFEPIWITNDGTLYTFSYTLKPNETGVYTEALNERTGERIRVSAR